MDFKRKLRPKKLAVEQNVQLKGHPRPASTLMPAKSKLANGIAVVSGHWQLIEVLDDRTARVADHFSVSVAV